MVRATHSIATRFDSIVKTLETLILSQLEKNQEKYNAVLHKISDKITEHANVINNQGKQIASLYELMKQDNKRLSELITLYAELAACGVMESKRKENLKAEINKLINPQQ